MSDIDSLWNFDDPAATEAAFRRVLPGAESAGGGEPLELLTQIARTYSLRRDYATAHELLDQVASRMAPAASRVRVRYLLERGRCFNSAGQREIARTLFVEAWDLARRADEDAFAVDAAHMIAITESGQKALRWNEAAIAHAEQSKDPRARRWLGSLYNNLGWTYHDLERYGDALDRFKRALAAREAQGEPGPIRVARWCIARCLRSLGRPDEALAAQQALRAEHEAAGVADAYVCEEIAECLLALGREDEAGPAFALAYREISRIAERDGVTAQRLERLKSLSA